MESIAPATDPSVGDAGRDSAQSDSDTVDNDTFPPTYVVIKFPESTQPRAISWLVAKIVGRKRDGGAELLVRRQPPRPGLGVMLHVSATKRKLLEAAEEMELKKLDRMGLVRDLTVAKLDDFLIGDMSEDDLLTTADRQAIVRHELENIRAGDVSIPGYPMFTMYQGQSIVHVMLQTELILSIYALHDREALKKLFSRWLYSKTQPIEEIRLYFGEAVALYFKFLDFYTLALLAPMAVLGCLQYVMMGEAIPFFCVFNVIAVTVFLEVWRRRSNEAAFLWGTIGMTSLDEPRPNYHGTMQVDPISKRVLPQFPRRTTNLRMYCVSFPIVILALGAAFIVMLASFWAEEYLTKLSKLPDSNVTSLMVWTPSIVYTGLVYVMNHFYRRLATFLTEWENHRTQSQFERHRVLKLVAFEFVNTFMALFYIAFVYQDVDMLRTQLATMLVILQFINNAQEALLSTVLKLIRFTSVESRLTDKAQVVGSGDRDGPSLGVSDGLRHRLHRSATGPHEDVPPALQNIPELEDDDPRTQQAIEEGEMEVYEGTYDDYLEIFIQFGYVFLFSAVYPMAALWALINNVIETRVDAFKLCRFLQRPFAHRVKDTGAWQVYNLGTVATVVICCLISFTLDWYISDTRAFEAVGAMSIMTNCAILCVSGPVRRLGADVDPTAWLLRWVLLEHALLGIRYLLHQAIPDKPEWVRVALATLNHQSKEALKRERAIKRRLSSRRFQRGTKTGEYIKVPS